ncbi:ureidoglycolate hydrolase [Microdochium bolleyi]|uniref:Ureidoglycolate hydrolase n=1 Tax=Microdochium bolleyi TaxID=196109 RepID=A0A136J0P6_9PEZI|nr:ureidoglycolate hydrolase [Microdochium bolleyi]
MIIQSIPIPESRIIPVSPLTRAAFAPFGTAIANPRPECRPQNTSPASIGTGALPYGAVSANQGSAIQYRALASMQNLYGDNDQHNDGSKRREAATADPAATPRMTMFVCAARDLGASSTFQVNVLERHPFTSQTFIPLTADAEKRYLVIVAPTLPVPAAANADKSSLPPTPPREEEEEEEGQAASTTTTGDREKFRLPGPGLPDLGRIAAFVATGEQAVTYGAGTWHAPMVALGPAGSTIDFVVVQFANDVPVMDCQEVELTGYDGDRMGSTTGKESRKIVVQVPRIKTGAAAKL